MKPTNSFRWILFVFALDDGAFVDADANPAPHNLRASPTAITSAQRFA